MSGRTLLVSSPLAASYDLGEGHPMRAIRSVLTTELAEQIGVLARPGWFRRDAAPARIEELALVHTETYIAMLRAADRLPAAMLASIGIGTQDTPLVPGLHDAAAAVAGATLAACAAVWSGDALHAFNLTGGLHHAMPGSASGFCVYNDPAIGIADLLRAGCARVAYVDLDAHHGDGVEAIFARDPRVLTISVHQDGRTLFPGSGAASDVGSRGAAGSSVNVALPPGTRDADWLRALSGIVPVLLRRFHPDVLVTQCGCDGHARDPLSDLLLTVEGFTIAYEMLHALAHEVCAGRWVVLGGGGYDLGNAVPRSWTQLLAVGSGGALRPDTSLPPSWRVLAERISGQVAPPRIGDGDRAVRWQAWKPGDGDAKDCDAANSATIDGQVAATREAVFPLLGLDPLSDV